MVDIDIVPVVNEVYKRSLETKVTALEDGDVKFALCSTVANKVAVHHLTDNIQMTILDMLALCKRMIAASGADVFLQ